MRSPEMRFADGWEADENGCHLWLKARNSRGYGVIWFDGKLRLAHRLAWYLAHDSWPVTGMVIDHICCVKACVNPDHLRELTNWENIRRAYPIPDEDAKRKRIANRKAHAKYRGYSQGYSPYESGDNLGLV